MEKLYAIKKLPEGAGHLAFTGEFDPARLPADWAALNIARIDSFPWDENGYRPEAFACAGWNEQGIHLLLAAKEAEIRTEMRETGGMACEDSCLEFFLMPAPDQSGFNINIEITPLGVVHLGKGMDRYGRTVYTELPDGFSVAHSEHKGGWWAISYTVPASFLQELGARLVSGTKMRGNFYKCGDHTRYVHFGMWKPYDLPAADFHRPELFGDFILE